MIITVIKKATGYCNIRWPPAKAGTFSQIIITHSGGQT
nr:MAG TPA: hypothetical protein [Caudoviricetes sp.]